MRLTPKTIRHVLALLFLWSTWRAKALTSQTSPVLTLSRTVCFGTRPAYDLALFPDESIQWTGKQFVDAVGSLSATMRP